MHKLPRSGITQNLWNIATYLSFFVFPFQESLSSYAPSLESSATCGENATHLATSATQNDASGNPVLLKSLYHLHVCLRNGRELIARDSGGTSDPYVKFYWRGKQVYKSKTIDKDLNPVWDESFILAIDDPFVPLDMKVSHGIDNLNALDFPTDWCFR